MGRALAGTGLRPPQLRRRASRPQLKRDPLGSGMAELSHQDFLDTVLTEFPQLRGDVDDYDGLLHPEVGAFAQFTQRAKGRADWDTYARCVRLIDRLFQHADSELENAIQVSFLEHLDFEGPRGAAAWKLLSPALQMAWKRITAYNERRLTLPTKKRKKKKGP